MAKEMNENEIWKKIPGEWDLPYEISGRGIVRYWWEKNVSSAKWAKYSKTKNGYRYFKPHHHKIGYGNGYLSASLARNGIRVTIYIHRLLAITFIPNPHNKPQVNHIDGNSLNNEVSNLEWATAKENINHAWDTGLVKGLSTGRCKRIDSSVTKRVRSLSKEGMSQEKIAVVVGIDQHAISDIIHYKKRYQNL